MYTRSLTQILFETIFGYQILSCFHLFINFFVSLKKNHICNIIFAINLYMVNAFFSLFKSVFVICSLTFYLWLHFFFSLHSYSIPSISIASINVVSIYVVKFFVPSNFNLCRHSIYVAFFWNQLRRKSRNYCKFIQIF